MLRTTRRDLMFGSLVSASLLGCAPSLVLAQSDRLLVGIVEQLEGDASAGFGGEVRPLTLGDPIFLDDLVATGPDGRLGLRLEDETEFVLGENARVTIDRFIYQPANGIGRFTAGVVTGAFLFVSGQMSKQEDRDITIRSAVGTMGIRGTRFWGGPLDSPFEVFVFDGLVEVTQGQGSVTLEPGQGVGLQQPGVGPAIGEGDVIEWDDTKIGRAVATVTFRS